MQLGDRSRRRVALGVAERGADRLGFAVADGCCRGVVALSRQQDRQVYCGEGDERRQHGDADADGGVSELPGMDAVAHDGCDGARDEQEPRVGPCDAVSRDRRGDGCDDD